jgi:diguanylate cyclase (GGDEF)-like protein/putative nucleotidyltransferase with HDIG domain
MQPPATAAPPIRNPLIIGGWLLLAPWTIAMFFVSLRSDTVSLYLRQVLFLAPLVCAVLCLLGIRRYGPPSLERSAWSLLCLATTFVLAGEVYYSSYQILVDSAGPSGFSAYDGLNAIGAVVIVSGMARIAGLSRARRGDNLRLIADVVAVLSVAYMTLYHFWVSRLAAGHAPWTASVRWTAYSLVGLVILVLVVLCYVNLRPIRFAGVLVPLGISLVIFSLGLVMSPVWQSSQSQNGTTVEGAAVVCIVMIGYYLLFLSALTRLLGRNRSWREGVSRLAMSSSIWPSTVLSATVFVAVGYMGWWAFQEPIPAAHSSLYVAAAVIATLALVARTGFASLEAGEWRSSSATDPVTGALNHRSFQELCEERIAAARHGEPFTIALLDIDAFSRINRVVGHAEGDMVLREVATMLRTVEIPGLAVCRLSGDEFAVIGPGVDEAAAMRFGRLLLSAVHRVDVPGLPGLSASVGVATCSGADCDREQLLLRADAAQAWAKYHGKNRVVAHDEHMVRALGVEERLRIREHESHLGIARALSAAVDARDSRNYYHSRNVAALVALLCAELSLDDELTRRIEIAAMLHDVGKITLSDEVLRQTTPSPRQERAAREHVTLGATLVESLGDPEIPEWVRAHHERWDGTGYPDGLAGAAIPYEARVIALADAYDSMTSGRRSGRQMSKGAALQEIDHGIGTRFDPDLAETFIHVVGMTPSLGWSDDWSAA